MSWRAIHWAKLVRTGGVAPKAILLVLADYADEHHSCFPGQARLAFETEMSVRTVQRQLAALEKRGLIRIEARGDGNGKGGRTSNRYTLLVDEPQGDPLSDKMTGGVKRQNRGGYTSPVAYEPPENHQLQEGGRARARMDEDDIPDDDPTWETQAEAIEATERAFAAEVVVESLGLSDRIRPDNRRIALAALADVPTDRLATIVDYAVQVKAPRKSISPGGLIRYRIEQAIARTTEGVSDGPEQREVVPVRSGSARGGGG